MPTSSVADVHVRHDAAVVRLHGEIDISTQDDLRAALLTATASASDLTVDLGDVAFIDWTGLALVLDAVRSVRDRGGAAVVTCPSVAVRRLLQLLDSEHLLAGSG